LLGSVEESLTGVMPWWMAIQKLGKEVQRQRKMHIVIFYESKLSCEAGFEEHKCLPSQVLGL
jgi:hypothetical protein